MKIVGQIFFKKLKKHTEQSLHMVSHDHKSLQITLCDISFQRFNAVF